MTLSTPTVWVLASVLISSIALLLVWRQKKGLRAEENRLVETLSQMEARLRDDVSNFVSVANERFSSEQTKSKALFENSKQSVELQIGQLGHELSKIEALVRNFEEDRARKFGSLEEKITQTAKAAQNLSDATQELNAVIGNNQLRGQWGEKMAEDILRSAGLEPGIHYAKNESQESVSTRPDYTFYLPDKHKVYMDVKFPLSHYLELMSAQTKEAQGRHSEEFIRDVKNRIRELKKRDYINPEEQTLDYLILFIPNEQIFGYIHREAPGIMDEALSLRILLASPYSLFGILSIIRQAFDNFHFRKSTGEILKHIQLFSDDYDNFKKRFTDLGETLDKAKDKYLEVQEKSFKRLEQRIRRLDDFRKGELPAVSQDKDAEKSSYILQ